MSWNISNPDIIGIGLYNCINYIECTTCGNKRTLFHLKVRLLFLVSNRQAKTGGGRVPYLFAEEAIERTASAAVAKAASRLYPPVGPSMSRHSPAA